MTTLPPNHQPILYRQQEVYYPIKAIDLKDALSAEPSLKNELAFYIHTPTRRIKFKTDSELARADWVKAIQKSIFHTKMNEDNVKVNHVSLYFSTHNKIVQEKGHHMLIYHYCYFFLLDLDSPLVCDGHSDKSDVVC